MNTIKRDAKLIYPSNENGAENIVFCTGSLIKKIDYEKNPLDAIATNRPLNTKENKNAFGGLFNKVKVGMFIKKVIYSDPVTIVFWSDNTKTTCKTQHGDVYNKEMGLTLCVLKKLVGGDQVAKLIKDWVTENNVVDLKMLREKERKANKKSKKVEAKEEATTEEKSEEVFITVKNKKSKVKEIVKVAK